ncbi:hypothetical protein BD770DRAFT_67412 [Pilaira anomala]|nr:hypothetical protein BD770DRAFT_67412 [Pilaira anomala]
MVLYFLHSTNYVYETYKSRGAIDCQKSTILSAIYFPPYSLTLSPIEKFWSKLKAGVKR